MTLAENIECVKKALDYIAMTDDKDTFDEQCDCIVALYQLIKKLKQRESERK